MRANDLPAPASVTLGRNAVETTLVPGTGVSPATAVADMAGFTHGYADLNGTRLHYVKGGSGPAVVLLHGWPATWVEWRSIMPTLAQAGFTVIARDLRGVAESAKPDAGYDKRNVAEDVRQLVSQLGFDDIDLVGTDIGMMVAYAYAAVSPGRVRRLVLAESLLPGFGLEELMNPATGGYWHFGFHMQVDLAAMLTAGKEAAYLDPMWSMFAPHGGITAADRSEYLRQYASPGGMRGGFQHYGNLVEDGKVNRAAFRAPLEMPVLVLNGDQGIPQAQTLAGVRQVAAHVEVGLVPNSGHAFAAENPPWVAERLIRFFNAAPAIDD
jgi:pimeloyl-ACP methyl ester carboxylesterase